MAVTFGRSGTAIASVGGAGTVTIPLPNVYAKNDIAVLTIEHANQPLTAAPSGWTLVTSGSGGTAGSTTACGLMVYWKRLTAYDDAGTQTGANIAVPATCDHMYARIHTIEGCVVTGTPFDTPAAANDAAANTTVSFPSVTTTVANALVALIAGNGRDSIAQNMGVPTNAALTGISENVDDGDSTGNGGGVSIATGTKTTAGVVGASSATAAGAQPETTITVAFKPETASANLPPTLTGGTPANQSVLEGQAWSDTVTSDKAVTWTLGGADAASFTKSGETTTSCTLNLAAKNFESGQTKFFVTLTGTTAAGLRDTKSIIVWIENVHENSAVPGALMTAWKFATAGASTALGSTGLTAWTNPGNIVSDNNVVATFAAPGGGGTSEFLRATGFGFTSSDVPDGSTILGIEFLVGRTTSGATQTSAEQLFALKGGAGSTADRAGTAKGAEDFLQSAEDADLFGDAGDLWGTTWTPAEVRAASFGLECQAAYSSSQTMTVDYVQARIIYTPPSTRRMARDCRCSD